MKSCNEHKLDFATFVATTNILVGDEFQALMKIISKKLEIK